MSRSAPPFAPAVLARGVLLALPLLAALPATLFTHDPVGRDQGVFAYIAWRWLAGETPYLMAGVEHKGPLVFAAYAVAFKAFGTAMASARWLAWIALAVTAGLVAEVGRRLWPRSLLAGPLAGALYALLVTLSGLSAWWDGAQTEAFMEPLLVAALLGGLLCQARGPGAGRAPDAPDAPGAATFMRSRPGRGVDLALGGLVGLASLGKPTGLAWLLPLAFGLPGPAARRLPGLLIGALAAWAAALAYFVARGAGAAFLDNALLVNVGYGGQGLLGLPRVGGLFLRQLLRVLPAPLLAAALLALVALFRRGPRPVARFVGLWLAAALLALLVQGRMFLYHFTPLVAPVALLLAGGAAQAAADLRGRATPPAWRAAGALALVLLVAGLAAFPWSELSLRRAWRAGRVSDAAFFAHLSPPGGTNDVDPGETERAAAWARAHVAPDQTLLVWGFEPAVNFLARRASPTRYIYDYFLTSPAVPLRAQEAAWRLFQADLAARPPDFIAVVAHDTNPVETVDSATQLRQAPALRRLLAEAYAPVDTVGDFAFYRRRAAP